MNFKWTACLLFGGFTLTYLFFSPGAIAGMGYTGEDIRAAGELISATSDWLERRPSTTSIDWPRNGVVPLLFDMPFLALGRARAQKDFWEDRYLAVGPILATSLLLVIVFLWIRKVTGNPVWSFGITLIAGFATFLWPYAYIGLETKQSLALLIAAYLAIGPPETRRAIRTAAFVVACAAAVSVKSTGLFLVPAVLYLVYEYFVRAPSGFRDPRTLVKLSGAVVFIGALFAIDSYTRSLFWVKTGGTTGFLTQWMIPDVTSFFANVISFFGSANKGLFWYAPATLLGVFAMLRLPRSQRRLQWFTLLTLAGLVGGFSMLMDWSDETWGPRYLHSAVAPLMLCLGASSYRFRARARVALAGLALAGVLVAFLGSFFTYGSLQAAATTAGQDTIEAYQGDVVWNHIRFDARLLGIWMRYGNTGSPHPVWWVPEHHWFYAVPPGAGPWKPVDLAPLAEPQSIAIRGWTLPAGVTHGYLYYVYLSSLPLGIAMLICVFFRVKWEFNEASRKFAARSFPVPQAHS